MSPAVVLTPALTVVEYADKAKQSDRFKNRPDGLLRLKFGFYGEIGGLLASVKKVTRDTLFETAKEFASEELGDALWYLVALAQESEVHPDELGAECLSVLRARFNEGVKDYLPGVSFRQMDGLLATQLQKHADFRDALLGELAHDAGILARVEQPQVDLEDRPSPVKQLGHILATLALTTASFDLQLEEVARANLVKIASRWPGIGKQWTPFFDGDSYPEYERFPRQFSVRFEERGPLERKRVVQSIRGIFVGDPLTDNSVEPDGYRFHDVFHLAYVAYLGWSPVIRGLLKRKRKSKPDVDENQDGARAMIIEEGIATWIFNHASKQGFYKDVDIGKLDYAVLKQIQSMVAAYEVKACPLWQWELAILKGFDIFRQLHDLRGGTVEVDMDAHTLGFSKLSEE
jgi:NTP pyrophosphatase (non-canonical NTP hydrolase)